MAEGKYKESLKDYLTREGFILPAELLSEFYSQLLGVSSFGLAGIMNAVAKRAGKRGAQLARQHVLRSGDVGREEALELARDFFSVTGLGELRVEDAGDLVRIEVAGGTVFARHMEAKKPVCGPVAAALGGFLEELLGRPVSAKESQCKAAGAESCVFEIRIKD